MNQTHKLVSIIMIMVLILLMMIDKYNWLSVIINLVKAPIDINALSQMDSSGSAVGATEEEDLRAEVRS